MLPQLIVSGIATGVLYALIALSMTVIYRATTVVNFGQGDLVMAGAFVMFVLLTSASVPFVASAIVAVLALFGAGALIQRLLIRPIARAPHLSLAMMALSVGYALRGVARVFWGQDVLTMPRVFPEKIYQVGSVVFTSDDLVVSGVVLALMLVLFVFFHLTRLGKIIQALFLTQRGAALVGINVSAYHTMMWGVGAALAAASGVLLAPTTLVYPDMGVWTLLRAFAAMTLGGFGSLHGAVIGGLILGILEKILGFYFSTSFIDVTAYIVVIVVLLIRPRGLFGQHATLRI